MKINPTFRLLLFILFPPTELKKMVYIRIWLILVVTQNLKKIHRLEAKILAHEVGKYEKAHGRQVKEWTMFSWRPSNSSMRIVGRARR